MATAPVMIRLRSLILTSMKLKFVRCCSTPPTSILLHQQFWFFQASRPANRAWSGSLAVPSKKSALPPSRCQVSRGTPIKRFGLQRHGSSGNLALQGKSLTNRVNLQINLRLAWCKGHHKGGNRYSHDLRAGEVEGDARLRSKSCGVERVETEVEVVPTTRRTAGVFNQNSAVYHDADTNPQTFPSCGQPLTMYTNSNVRLEIMNPWSGCTAGELKKHLEMITAKHAKCDGKCLLIE